MRTGRLEGTDRVRQASDAVVPGRSALDTDTWYGNRMARGRAGRVWMSRKAARCIRKRALGDWVAARCTTALQYRWSLCVQLGWPSVR